MPKRGGKQRESDGQERSSFRWPSRELASASERAAELAAARGLERLRARAKRLRTPTPHPMQTAPPTPRMPDPTPPPPPAPSPAATELERAPEPEPQLESEPEPEREPASVPWDEELDALTEQLIADLRRDLGPETS